MPLKPHIYELCNLIKGQIFEVGISVVRKWADYIDAIMNPDNVAALHLNAS